VSSVRVGARTIDVSNQDKVLFPDEGITKGEVVDYYRRIADHMLPFLTNRPLVMRRFPDGIGQAGFFQKATPDHFPDWIDTVSLEKEEGGTVTHVIANDAATLVFLANQGVVEPHTLLAPASSPRHPDQMILDLDPSTDDTADVVVAARALRTVLDDLEVTGLVKSTGSRGVHVVIHLDGSADFDEARGVAGTLADLVVQQDPSRLTTAQPKQQRGDRVFIDWLRNSYAQHAVAPHGVRARPGAPVAAPLDWDEATSSSFDPQQYTIRNIFRRLAQKHDPWAGSGQHVYSVATLGQRLASSAA
jgi:bifunctional non-homologous end joining protein LigD